MTFDLFDTSTARVCDIGDFLEVSLDQIAQLMISMQFSAGGHVFMYCYDFLRLFKYIFIAWTVG